MLATMTRMATAIKVLESQIKLGDNREGVAISGAQVVPKQEAGVKVSDLTICTRVNLKILKGPEGFTNLWYIPEPNSQGQKVRVTRALGQFSWHVFRQSDVKDPRVFPGFLPTYLYPSTRILVSICLTIG